MQEQTHERPDHFGRKEQFFRVIEKVRNTILPLYDNQEWTI